MMAILITVRFNYSTKLILNCMFQYMAPPNAVLTASCFTDVEFNGEAPVGKMINIIKYHSRYPDEDNCLVLSVPKMEEGLSRSFTVSIYIHNHTKFIHIPKLL